jgi:acetoin utilization deacetylase AcuC-like enzyme/acyl-CoA hydrolase/GNAT superfamily N-acetyltransferase
MAPKPWQSLYSKKVVTAEKAVCGIRNGQTLFVGSGAGEPTLLTGTLATMAEGFWDIEVIHLSPAQEESPLAHPNLVRHFRYNTFYIGRGLSAAVAAGTADYTPMNISELPQGMADGIIQIDVALIQVSPPDAFGLCSLGVSVDATKAALEHARLVVAQVNEYVPVTLGDTLVPVESIDFLVEGNTPLIEVESAELDPVSLTIGRHVASLIEDGRCLHFDRGPISAATMRYLDTKRDLGIHTDILTDDIMRLIRSRAVTNMKKSINRGKTVATMVMGSKDLYRAVDKNPYFEILPIDKVNDPFVICQNDNMISVHAIQEIELTGLARADTQEISAIRSLPSSMDFINGATRSKGGFNIVALPSTTFDGSQSRIVALSLGGGVAFNRSKIDYVVTEYGVVNLYGLSIRERAIALISIAHPKFRAALLSEAKRLNYVGKEQPIPPEHGCVYPQQYEFTHTFKDDTEIFFRPVQPSDARRLQRMFYRLSPESVRMRYHGTIKSLPTDMAQRLAAIDYSKDMAIVGLVGPRLNPRIVAEGRTMYNPTNNMGEFDIVVDEEYQGRGVGTFLANHLNKIAYSRGLSGVYAEVISQNAATMALLSRAWPTAQKTFDSDSVTFTVRFPPADVERPKDSIVIYSGRFGDYTYGDDHPFNPGRARTTLQLLGQHDLLTEPWMRVQEPRLITKARLFESHDPEFINTLELANDGQWRDQYLRFHLGGDDCPIFPGLFDYVLLYTSATCTGVDLILDENANVVFNPLGGFHHASRSHSEGFCFVNDVIVAIDSFLARGFRVAYVDLDAHHGNGVQDAYFSDDRVLFISLHQTGKTLYPFSGFETEIGEGNGTGFTINVPLPEETDDEAYEEIFARLVPKALRQFGPSVIVAAIGADTHKSDPLSNLNLTNNGMVTAVKHLRDHCQHLLLLGAGGYDEQTTTRAWCRMWAAANRIDALPDYMLVMGGSFMGGAGIQGADLVDMQFRVSGDTKKAILKELDRIASFHEEHTLPLIGRSSAP